MFAENPTPPKISKTGLFLLLFLLYYFVVCCCCCGFPLHMYFGRNQLCATKSDKCFSFFAFLRTLLEKSPFVGISFMEPSG